MTNLNKEEQELLLKQCDLTEKLTNDILRFLNIEKDKISKDERKKINKMIFDYADKYHLLENKLEETEKYGQSSNLT